MSFVLKVRAVTGKLVPLRGEHVEYSDVGGAVADATILSPVYGPITVVNFSSDVEVCTV